MLQYWFCVHRVDAPAGFGDRWVILTALVTANFYLSNATIMIALVGVQLSRLIMVLAPPVAK